MGCPPSKAEVAWGSKDAKCWTKGEQPGQLTVIPAKVVHAAKTALRAGVALVGGEAMPFPRLGVSRWHAMATVANVVSELAVRHA